MSFWKQILFIVAIVMTSTRSAHGQTPVSDLTVAADAPAQSDPDTDVSVDVTVTNQGPDASDTVDLTNPMPPGATFVSFTQNSGTSFDCSPLPGVGSSGPVICTCPSLASASSANFTVVYHIDASAAPGTYFTDNPSTRCATDPNSENDSGVATTQTPPPPAADVRIEEVGPEASNPDTDVAYTFDVANGSNVDATNVSFSETIPGDLVLVTFSQTAGPAFTCSDGSNGTITCTASTLAAGATSSFRLVAHVPSGTGDGTTYQNMVTVTSNYDPNTENDSATTLLCVQGDSCAAGACNGNRAVVCAAPDQCHDPGTCNTVTGQCSTSLPKGNGAPCNDGDACTQADTCQSGVCTGASPVICPTADQCHDQRICDPTSGMCAANPPRADGTPCSDNNACTDTDSCQAGACQSGTPRNCDDGNACTTDSCDLISGCLHTSVCEAGPDAAEAVSDGAPDAAAVPDAADAAGPLPEATIDVAVVQEAAPDVVADVAPGRPDAAATADARSEARADSAALTADAAARDARIDSPVTRDAGTGSADAAPSEPPSDDGGCSCRTAGRRSSHEATGWLALIGLIVVHGFRAGARKRTMMTTSGWRPQRSASPPPGKEAQQARGEKDGEEQVATERGARAEDPANPARPSWRRG